MNTEDKLREGMAAARAEESVTHAEWTDFTGRAHRSLYMRRAAAAVGTLAIIGRGVAGGSTLLADDPTVRPVPPAGPTETVAPTPTPTPEEPATVRVPSSEQEV